MNAATDTARRLALREMAQRQNRTRPHGRWWVQVREDSRRADGSAINYQCSVYLAPTKAEQRRDPSLRGSGVGSCFVTVSPVQQ